MTETKKKESQIAIDIVGASYNLFGGKFGKGMLAAITQVPTAVPAPQRYKGQNIGSGQARSGLVKYPHPVSVPDVLALKDVSGHHCSCIQAKKYATVGLGFIDEGDEVAKTASTEEAIELANSLLSGRGHVESKVDKVLDPLTNFGFMNELLDIAEDFCDTGTGYLEVHRDSSGKIDGLAHIPTGEVYVCTFGGRIFYQYQAYGNTTKYWPLYGYKDWFLGADGPFPNATWNPEDISEVVPFLQPSNRVKYYGYPDWISASVDIDLLQKSKQYKADFYHNRGVLDKILVVTGATVDTDDWTKIKSSISSSIGAGNNFNSAAFNFANEKAKVEVKNMGVDGNSEEQFSKDNETLTQNIVSSHGVPPTLANILIPGKLGATNEFINALVGFELLRINSYQNVFEKQLANTLGKDKGLGLKPDDFRLRTITSQLDIDAMDTIGRMSSEVTSAENADRDLSEGVLE
jgi:hypothetical protein